jgi:hypothetical protein
MDKKEIDDYFNKNYKKLETVIKKNIKHDKHYLVGDIISICYSHLNDSKKTSKLIFKNEVDLNAYVICYIINSIKWKRTEINNMLNESVIDYYDIRTNEDEIDETIAEEELLQKEMEYDNKLNSIYGTLQSLTPTEKILFDLIFVKGYNSADKLSKALSTHIKIGRTSCWLMKKSLLNKIRDAYYDEQNNKKDI